MDEATILELQSNPPPTLNIAGESTVGNIFGLWNVGKPTPKEGEHANSSRTTEINSNTQWAMDEWMKGGKVHTQSSRMKY